MNRLPAPALALLLIAASARAQVPRDTTTLTPIVVTATRTPMPAGTLANGVTVLDGDALRRAGITTVIEALRGVPSIAFAQAGGYGAQTSMFLRGGESDYVRVLVDGVPLNQAGGFIDLANLTTENIDRIEVVRGPASVLYGSDAVTGVVQVITRSGAGRPRIVAEGRGGSYGSGSGLLELSGGSSRAGLSAGVQREVTDGINPFNNRYDNTAGSARLTLTPDRATDVGVSVSYRDGTLHYPTNGSGVLADSNQLQRSRQVSASLDAGRRLGPRLEVRALLGLVSGRDSVNDAPDGPADTLGIFAYYSRITTTRRTADLRVNLRASAPLLLTLGASLDRESERSANRYQSAFGSGGGTTDTARTNRAVYGEMVAERGIVGIQAGVRLDDNEKFGTFTTARLGVSLRVAPLTRLRANVGSAFKEPTFGENYSSGFSTGNPDLRPERSASAEVGVEQTMVQGRITASLTGFTQRFRDLIQYSFGGGTAPDYHNVAAATASGAELEVRAQPTGGLGLSAQYTWLHTSASDSGYDGTVFAKGQRLLRRPTHAASLSGEWRSAAGPSVGARVLYVGDRTDVDFTNFPGTRVTLAAYTRLDVWTRFVVVRSRDGRGSLALTGRVENLTGASYQEVSGFRTPGRRIGVGARFSAGQ